MEIFWLLPSYSLISFHNLNGLPSKADHTSPFRKATELTPCYHLPAHRFL